MINKIIQTIGKVPYEVYLLCFGCFAYCDIIKQLQEIKEEVRMK